jgi:hypothetical protein
MEIQQITNMVFKICISSPENTGKIILGQKIANH